MKREEVKKHIEGITDEQLDWLMSENGKETEKAKKFEEKANSYDQLKAEYDKLKGEYESAQESLKGFDGVNVSELQELVKTLTNELEQQKNQSAFDYQLDLAITNAHGRNIKAIRSMLDLDALKKSEDLSKGIEDALNACAEANSWAFESDTSSINVNLGTEHGSGGNSDEISGVERAFYALNPTLKK